MDSYHQHRCENCSTVDFMTQQADGKLKCKECGWIHPKDHEAAEERDTNLNTEQDTGSSGTELGASIGDLTDQL